MQIICCNVPFFCYYMNEVYIKFGLNLTICSKRLFFNILEVY